MPSNYFDKDIESIEDIGEPSKASVFSLSNVDPTNWYIYSCRYNNNLVSPLLTVYSDVNIKVGI